jgi:hypothetical protein
MMDITHYDDFYFFHGRLDYRHKHGERFNKEVDINWWNYMFTAFNCDCDCNGNEIACEHDLDVITVELIAKMYPHDDVYIMKSVSLNLNEIQTVIVKCKDRALLEIKISEDRNVSIVGYIHKSEPIDPPSD